MGTRRATKPPEPGPSYTVQNCNFSGVHWDTKAIEAVQTVAQALLNLTTLFKSQNVTMEAMLKLVGPEATVADSKLRT